MAISSASLLIALIALPFAGSCLAALFRANARNAEAYLAGIVSLIAFVLVVASYPRLGGGGVLEYKAAWVRELGLEFSLRMDGFAWVLAGLITGIGFLVVISPASTQAKPSILKLNSRPSSRTHAALYSSTPPPPSRG